MIPRRPFLVAVSVTVTVSHWALLLYYVSRIDAPFWTVQASLFPSQSHHRPQRRQSHPPYHPRDPSKLHEQFLNPEALELLRHGRPYKVQDVQETADGYSGSGLVLQDVQAPPSTVWKILLDWEAYPRRVPKVNVCHPYQVPPPDDDDDDDDDATTTRTTLLPKHPSTYGVQMTIGIRSLFFQLCLQHQYFPQHGVLLWALEEDNGYFNVQGGDPHLSRRYYHHSDWDESVGYWFVQDHPTHPDWSRVTYRIHFHVPRSYSLPSYAYQFLTQQGLNEATKWVKTYSEKEYRREQKQQRQQQQQQQRKRRSRAKATETGSSLTSSSSSSSSTVTTTTTSSLEDSKTHLITERQEPSFPTARISPPFQAQQHNTFLQREDEEEPSLDASCLVTEWSGGNTVCWRHPQGRMGQLRYVLVSSVAGLILFNTYLYFSHYRYRT